jgi:DNA invertase Pin-like site-specific DNA recombinase
MSTEHQQYSLENQTAAIARYAAEHGFLVTHTYTDAGKSGVVLNRRHGLRQLLQDVISGTASYKVVLVYDVSRWGRFQDVDEAAHHEFICRSAGVPVHYCAEPFSNDGTLPSMIMKALKRMMAGEYSRELSVKVYEGSKRLAKLGLKQGGLAGYGYRRLLISATGQPKGELLAGQRKNIQEDRVVLVPGPDHEVQWVKEIFRLFTENRKKPKEIAKELNLHGVKYNGVRRHEWYAEAVNRVLRNPKYIGWNVYGRSSQRLHMPRITMPKPTWTVVPGAWPPLVDQGTFDSAQAQFANQTVFKSNEQLIDELAALLRAKGTLSERLVMAELDLPSQGAYRSRFGSMSQAFALAGYGKARLKATEERRKRRTLRDQFIADLVGGSRRKISIVQPNGHWRPQLRLPNRSLVSVYVCPSFRNLDGACRWSLNPVSRERRYVSLIAQLNMANDAVQDCFVLPDLRGRTRWSISPDDVGLKRGKQLRAPSDLIMVVQQVRNGIRCRSSGPEAARNRLQAV